MSVRPPSPACAPSPSWTSWRQSCPCRRPRWRSPLLTADGWLFWPDDPNRKLSHVVPAAEPGRPHPPPAVIQHDHPAARAELVFRDVVASDPIAEGSLRHTQGRLAVRYRTDRDAYTDAKSDFVRSVLQAAGSTPRHANRWGKREQICSEPLLSSSTGCDATSLTSADAASCRLHARAEHSRPIAPRFPPLPAS